MAQPASQDRARIVFDCRMSALVRNMPSTIPAHFTMNDIWETVIKEGVFRYEKVHRSCFSALFNGDDAGFLRERTPDNDHDDASDECDYRTTLKNHAAHRLPRQ
jgi:hypothetical protein